jgi:tetratricopeptide (TPR) repeat protein
MRNLLQIRALAALLALLLPSIALAAKDDTGGSGSGGRASAKAGAAPAASEAQAETQATDEPVKGEPPRKLKVALGHMKKKEWAVASLSLYSVLEDPEAEAWWNDTRYYLAVCLDQMELPYSALEEYNRFFAGVEPGSELLEDALKRAVGLGRKVDAGWMLAPGLAKLDTSVVSTGYRGPAMYWVGFFHYSNRDWAAAKAYLSLVPKDTEFYNRARMVEGISLVREQKPVEAIAPLAAALAASRKDAAGDNTWEVANMNLGRAYFAIGNFERAIEHFEKTPKTSPFWFEALYEAAWGYFRLGRLSGALSHLQTIDSPFFDGVYHPDATLLRILIFYYLCKYTDGGTMLKEFTEEHYPIHKDIEAAISAAEKDPGKLFESLYAWKSAHKEAGVALPEPVKQHFASDESLLRIGDYLAGIDRELAAVDKLKTGWEKSALRKDLQDQLQNRRNEATAGKGKEALAKLRGMHVVLGEHLGNAEIYKVEMITAEKDIYQAAYHGKLMEKIAARKMLRDVPAGYRFWPFEGEYWMDELGWYEVNTVNECLEIQK